MSFNNQLVLAFVAAVVATVAGANVGPLMQDLVSMINANVITSAAIGLPILTTGSLLVALFVLQR